MDHKLVINNLLSSFSKLIDNLSSEDVAKLNSGDYELTLKIEKAKRQNKFSKKSASTLTDEVIEEVTESLNLAKTREEGLEVIDKHLKLKSDLESFAKTIDVAVMKSDRVEKIRNSIVDATVGARLRSGAIQGKEI